MSLKHKTQQCVKYIVSPHLATRLKRIQSVQLYHSHSQCTTQAAHSQKAKYQLKQLYIFDLNDEILNQNKLN